MWTKFKGFVDEKQQQLEHDIIALFNNTKGDQAKRKAKRRSRRQAKQLRHPGVLVEISQRLREEDLQDMPRSFECSISGCIMKDPVVAEDGYTYERVALEGWFERCMKTGVRSPLTNEVMGEKLVSNHTLRQVIIEYVERVWVNRFGSQVPIPSPWYMAIYE